MKVLVACEESQAVCKEFRRLGHEAYSADIQECSGGRPEWHILGDVLPLIDGDCEFDTMDGQHHMCFGKWDLLIAHPPCTYLTNAGARWLWAGGILNKERYQRGQEAKEFFMKFYNADCGKIVIENPVPSAVFDLPKYTQIVEPYMFGHPVTKKTCLWVKGVHPLEETSNVGRPSYEHTRYTQKNGKTRTVCWEMAQKGGSKRACERSKTFPGIAQAMAEQWGGKCDDNENR